MALNKKEKKQESKKTPYRITTKGIKKIKHFCLMPWFGLTVSSNGGIKPCCEFKSIYNIHHDPPPPDFYNRREFIDLRRDFLRGKKPAECWTCWEREKDVGYSERIFLNNRLWSFVPKNYELGERLITPKWLHAEINLSNICNLKCRMCGIWGSAGWLEDEKKLGQLNEDFYKELRPEYLQVIHNNLENLKPLFGGFEHIKMIEFKGGEPFLAPNYEECLKYLIKNDRHHGLSIDFVTNGTVINNKILKLLPRFKNVNIVVSVDGLGDLYKYIRGCNYSFETDIIKNIETYSRLPNVKIRFNVAIQTYNILKLADIHKYLNNLNIGNVSAAGAFQSYVNWPPYLSPFVLPRELQQLAYERLVGIKEFDQLRESLIQGMEDSALFEVFKSFTDHLDKYRNENVLDVIPEFKKHWTGNKAIIKQKNNEKEITTPIAHGKKYYPLSYAQRRVWVETRLGTNPDLQISTKMREFEGEYSERIFKKAFELIIERQSTLRTVFKEIDSEPVQEVKNKGKSKEICEKAFGFFDLTELRGTKKKEKIAQIIRKQINADYFPDQGPLARLVIIKKTKNSFLYVLSMHHIITDGRSMSLLDREIFQIYKAIEKHKIPDLPKLPIEYKDYAVWERSLSNKKRLIKQKKYWLTRLGKNPPVTKLPLDRIRGAILEYKRGYTHEFLSNSLMGRMQRIGQAQNTDILTVFFLIFSIYISKLTGKDDLIMGTVAEQRKDPGLANLIGYLGNDLPIRIRIKNNSTFKDLLSEVNKHIKDSLKNGEYPIEKLIHDLSSARDARSIRFYNTAIRVNEFNRNRPYPKDKQCGRDLNDGRLSHQSTNNDWGLVFEVFRDKTRLSSKFNAAVLKEETVKSWTADLVHLIRQIAKDPDKLIEEYEVVCPHTRHKLLKDFNKTEMKQHPRKAPHHYFEEYAQKIPDKTAVQYKGKKISYQKLEVQANQLANCLLNKGVKKGDIVAVDIGEKQFINIPKAILAIHKAGTACLMINRQHPKERIRCTLIKSRAKSIISDDNFKDYFSKEGGKSKRLIQIDITKNLDKYSSNKPKSIGIAGTDTAFISFTSGSTGKPKGIKVTARAIVNEAYNKVPVINKKDINALLQNFSLTFLPSLEMIYCSFILGKKIILIPPSELYDPYSVLNQADHHKLKYLCTPPSVLNAFLKDMEEDSNKAKLSLKHLSVIKLNGEIIHSELVMQFYSRYSHIILYSDGGSSEAQSFSGGIIPRSTNPQIIKDGKATRNQRVYILDNNQKLLPISAIGEIYVSGYGLASGYLGNKNLTRERFLPHPFIKGEKIFRSGDMGRIDHEGNIDIKGRLDDQVKIRGQRVELNEIREKIKKIVWISDVLVKTWEKGKKYELELVCYYTLKEKKTVPPEQIKATLRRELPNYMIPSYFVELNKFPLNQSGKIERNSLPLPTEKYLITTEYAEPKTLTEKKMASIWQEVLKIKRISRYDDFFDIGGHSLKAIQVLSKIRKTFDDSVSLRDVFENTTLSAISEKIEDGIVENDYKNNQSIVKNRIKK